MHHQIDGFIPEDFFHRHGVAEVHFMERHVRPHRLAVAEHKIVNNHRPVARHLELFHTMTANISGTADNKNIHNGMMDPQASRNHPIGNQKTCPAPASARGKVPPPWPGFWCLSPRIGKFR